MKKFYNPPQPKIYSWYFRKWKEFRDLRIKNTNEKFLFDVLSRKFTIEKFQDGKPHAYIIFPRKITELNFFLRLTTLRSAVASTYFFYNNMKHAGINAATKRYIADLRLKQKEK